jgi:Tfp pilus assembly protein PilX
MVKDGRNRMKSVPFPIAVTRFPIPFLLNSTPNCSPFRWPRSLQLYRLNRSNGISPSVEKSQISKPNVLKTKPMNPFSPRLASVKSGSRHTQLRSTRGFALVITMALMVLLMVLSVGLLSLSSIELRSSGANSAMMQARTNARLALQIAIGELQLQAGPDTRITAPGGQKIKGGTNSGRTNWVGVYDSWSDKDVNRPNPKFRKWLISGNPQVTTNEGSAAGNSALADATIPLVRATADNEAVEAGLVEVEDGAYAWWIADNNMKAKIGNTVEKPKDYREAIAQMQAAPWANPEPFFTGEIAKTDTRLNSLLTVGTAGLLGKPSQPLIHDATTIADGLVTNVRAGGFRKDLNFLLEKPYDQALSRQVLYTVGGTQATPGIHMGELWAAQNIWGEIISSANGPTLQAPAAVKDRFEDPFRNYHQLTRIQHTLIYSLISRVTGTGLAATYEVYLVIDPVVTIWNPFNITVTVPASATAFTALQNWGAPYDLTLEVYRGPVAGAVSLPAKTLTWTCPLGTIMGDGNFNTAKVGSTEPVVLRPGEVKIYSQSYNNNVVNKGSLEAKPGFGFGGGFQFKLGSIKPTPQSPPQPPFPDKSIPVADANPLPSTSRIISYKLTPSASSNNHELGMVFARQFIGDEDTNGYGPDMTGIGNMSVDFTSKNVSGGERDGKNTANNFKKFFRDIKYTGNAKQVSQMAVAANSSGIGKKFPMFVFNLGFRTEEDEYGPEMAAMEPKEQTPVRYTSRGLMGLNPKMLTYDLGDLGKDATNETPLQIGIRGDLTSFSGLIPSNGNQGYFGASFKDGVSYVTTHAVPRQPIYSLGALQHSMANGLRNFQDVGIETYQKVQYLRPSISHAISNSFAPSVMAPSQTESSVGSGKYAHRLADHSFLANRALWDDYFYSSISPRTTSAHKSSGSAYAEQKDRLTNFFTITNNKFVPLPNSRFRPWGNADRVTEEIFSGNRPSDVADKRIGAHLLIDGAFNVNSTSVRAWESMLLSLKGSSVPVSLAGSTSSEPSLTIASKTPVAGQTVAAGGEISDGDLNSAFDNQQWLGFRSLTDDQIHELASAIVTQVKLRGPFTSLSDFINRRPGSDKDLALSGALQSALDDSSVTINKAFRSGNRAGSVGDATTKGFQFPEAEAIAKSAGAPGYVKQGDLLTTLGPLLAVRGDTFTIRTCGEARDQQGKILARAYCEAVVQRIPDYVDTSDANYEPVPQAPANLQFGRKFQIISFRNLSPEEL